jgi:VanZ family protein
MLAATLLTLGLDLLVGWRAPAPLSLAAALAWCVIVHLGLAARAPDAVIAAGIVASLGILAADVRWPALLGGALLGAGAGAAAHGLCVERELRERLRWLLWPQIALAAAITDLAYQRRLPYRLLDWPGADKVLHFVLFGAVVFWLDLWLRRRALRVAGCRIPLALLLAFGVAAAEEALQGLSAARSASIGDLLCDLAGMTVAVWASRRVFWPARVDAPYPESFSSKNALYRGSL